MLPTLANAGIPTLFILYPPMVVLILPVIAIEFWAARSITQVPARDKWAGLAIANALSTFIGWPVTWSILVAIRIATDNLADPDMQTLSGKLLAVVLQAPWLDPNEHELYWMIPTAMMLMMIPFYFISVYLERWVLQRYWQMRGDARLTRHAWISHLYSYGFLLMMIIASCFL